MKKCSTCKIEKDLESFNKCKTNKDGLHYVCKDCRKKERLQNREHIQKKQKEYYESNKEELLIKNKQYRVDKKEEIYLQRKEYRELKKEHIKMKNKEYLPIRKKKIQEKAKTELLKNEEEIVTDDPGIKKTLERAKKKFPKASDSYISSSIMRWEEYK